MRNRLLVRKSWARTRPTVPVTGEHFQTQEEKFLLVPAERLYCFLTLCNRTAQLRMLHAGGAEPC